MGTDRQTSATVLQAIKVFNRVIVNIPSVKKTYVYAIKMPRTLGSLREKNEIRKITNEKMFQISVQIKGMNF